MEELFKCIQKNKETEIKELEERGGDKKIRQLFHAFANVDENLNSTFSKS